MQICVGRVPYIVYTCRAQETEASTAGAFGSTKWIAWRVGSGGGRRRHQSRNCLARQNAGTIQSAGVLREREREQLNGRAAAQQNKNS